VNSFAIQLKQPSRAECRRALDFGVTGGVAWPSCYFLAMINHGLALTRTYLAISRSQSQTWLSRTTNAIGSGLNLTSLQSEVGRAWPLEIPSVGPVAGAGIPAGAGGASLALVGTAVPAVRNLGFGGRACIFHRYSVAAVYDRRRSSTPTTSAVILAERPRTAVADRRYSGNPRYNQIAIRAYRELCGLGAARPTTVGKSTGGTPVQLFSAGNRRQSEVWIA